MRIVVGLQQYIIQGGLWCLVPLDKISVISWRSVLLVEERNLEETTCRKSLIIQGLLTWYI